MTDTSTQRHRKVVPASTVKRLETLETGETNFERARKSLTFLSRTFRATLPFRIERLCFQSRWSVRYIRHQVSTI